MFLDYVNIGVGGEGVPRVLLASVSWPMTTHPFWDGTPILLLSKTPATSGRSLRFIQVFHINYVRFLSPSVFEVCGHNPSPRIAIVLSLHSSLRTSSMPRTSNFLTSSSNASRSSKFIKHFLPCESYSISLCHTGTYLKPRPPPPDYWNIFFFCLVRPIPLHQTEASAFSPSPLGRPDTSSFQHLQ